MRDLMGGGGCLMRDLREYEEMVVDEGEAEEAAS